MVRYATKTSFSMLFLQFDFECEKPKHKTLMSMFFNQVDHTISAVPTVYGLCVHVFILAIKKHICFMCVPLIFALDLAKLSEGDLRGGGNQKPISRSDFQY